MDYSKFDAIGCGEDSDDEENNELEAARWMERANKLVNEEKMIGQAVDMYQRAAKIDPSLRTRAALNSATAYYQVGNWQLCIEKCREALPHAKAVEILDAALLNETRRATKEKDAVALAECIENLPCIIERALAGDTLANLLNEIDPRRAYEAARRASEDFERVASTSISHRRTSAHCALSAAYLARKQPEDAADKSRHHFCVAMRRFAALKDFESAAKAAFEAKEWRECAEYSSQCSSSLDSLLGIALMELGRYGEAIGPLTKLPPTLVNSERLARAYVGASRYADADAVLAVAVQDCREEERARLVEFRATVAEHRRDLAAAVELWNQAAGLWRKRDRLETAAEAEQRALKIQEVILLPPEGENAT